MAQARRCSSERCTRSISPSRLVRQVEFLSSQTEVGTGVPNDLIVRMNSADINETVSRDVLVDELRIVVTETATQRGWRLVGPVEIHIVTSTDVPRGIVEVDGTNKIGPIPPWGQFLANDGSAVLDLTFNRTMLGRSLDCDIRVANHEVSRHHVIVFREDGNTMATDLGSANGTFVNGVRLADRPVPISAGDTVTFGNVSITYRPIF